MLKRLQSPRMFELGDRACSTKVRRASKTEFDVHGMDASINVLSIYESVAHPLLPFARNLSTLMVRSAGGEGASPSSTVMGGLDPAIHVLLAAML
jgi:hypothetical protein